MVYLVQYDLNSFLNKSCIIEVTNIQRKNINKLSRKYIIKEMFNPGNMIIFSILQLLPSGYICFLCKPYNQKKTR